MANIQSQIKRNRQNERRRLRNKAVRAEVKTAEKAARQAVDSGDAETAGASIRDASRLLDKAVAKSVVHKRTAARRKSRLARRGQRPA
ncbi:MAG: 30S ribosomal protein S20 [Actinomycetota bacterium]